MSKIKAKEIMILPSIMINRVSHFMSGFIKRKKNRVIVGAWGGKKFGDNSKFLLFYLLQNKNMDVIWCGRRHLENEVMQINDVKFVKHNSLKAIYYCATSNYAFVSHNYRDFAYLNVLKGAVVTQLWHGFGIKKIRSDKPLTPIYSLYYHVGSKSYEKFDYFISSSTKNTEKLLSAFSYCSISDTKVLKYGQPKNDYLIKNNHPANIAVYKNKLLSDYNLPLESRIILYLPTFREYESTFSFQSIPDSVKKRLEYILLSHKAVIFEKPHSADQNRFKKRKSEQCVFTLESNLDTQELLLAADVLITDYSSCYLDYLLLDRPVIHFAYDISHYISSENGFYYDLYEYAAGPVVVSLDELLTTLDHNLYESQLYDEKRMRLKQTMMNYETGHSCEKICSHIFPHSLL